MTAARWAALAAGAVLAVLAAAPARAQVAVGAHASTAGVGPDLQYRWTPYITFRGEADWMGFGLGARSSGVDYHGQLSLETGGLFVDYHPWANAVFVSGGAYLGDRHVDLDAHPAGTVSIGGQSYTAAEAGSIDGRMKLASAAPFVGLGLDSSGQSESPLGLKALVGVAFSGDPSVTLSSSGGVLSGSPTLQQSLDAEAETLRRKATLLEYYPVIGLGATYHF